MYNRAMIGCMYIQGNVYIRNATGLIKKCLGYGMFSYRKPAINPPTFDGRVNFSLFKISVWRGNDTQWLAKSKGNSILAQNFPKRASI